MRYQEDQWWRKRLVVVALTLLLIAEIAAAQNLGSSPQLNVAVQGQTGAQPEGAFLNFINWVGNVISPVGAGGAIVGAVVSWLTGRGFGRWLFAAAAPAGAQVKAAPAPIPAAKPSASAAPVIPSIGRSDAA